MNQQPTNPDPVATHPSTPSEIKTVDLPSLPLVQIDFADSPASEPDSNEDRIGANSSPQELVQWGLERFADQPMVLTTSFGMEGCVLMDMCSQVIEQQGLEPLTVACIDTGFFFPETKQLRKKLVERYANLNFVTWETPVSIQQQREVYGDLLWQNNPNLCCNIRKVQPMRENITNYRIWITALRRSQTELRADTPVLNWDWRYQLLKFCPLASWSRAEVWQYIQEHEVPFNQLHLQNYPSVSCFHCTKPVPGSSPDSEARKGRWADTDKDECGLHFSI
jgi:phosphoadenosine phosphosulfate reductase